MRSVCGGIPWDLLTRYPHFMTALTERKIRASRSAAETYKLHDERGLQVPSWRVEKLLILGAPDVSPTRAELRATECSEIVLDTKQLGGQSQSGEMVSVKLHRKRVRLLPI